MKKNYISPAVEIVMSQPTTIIASSEDPGVLSIRDDMPVDDPDFVQTKEEVFNYDLNW